MLVMGMGILDILVAYEQLRRSLGYRGGGQKHPQKHSKTSKKAIKRYILKINSK